MASKATFAVFIDESGQEGLEIKPGTSQWFVLSGAVFRRSEEITQVKLVDEVRARINQGRAPEQRIPDKRHLHFRDLKHEPRKFYANRIAQARVRTISVLIYKPGLQSETLLYPRLYYHAARLLLEQVCACCRDWYCAEDEGDGSVEIVFSNGHNMSIVALNQFFADLLDENSPHYLPDANGILRPQQVATFKPGKRIGLQIADAVASSHFYAVETSEWGMLEDGYARLLLPCAYRHNGQVWGHGICLITEAAKKAWEQGIVFDRWER